MCCHCHCSASGITCHHQAAHGFAADAAIEAVSVCFTAQCHLQGWIDTNACSVSHCKRVTLTAKTGPCNWQGVNAAAPIMLLHAQGQKVKLCRLSHLPCVVANSRVLAHQLLPNDRHQRQWTSVNLQQNDDIVLHTTAIVTARHTTMNSLNMKQISLSYTPATEQIQQQYQQFKKTKDSKPIRSNNNSMSNSSSRSCIPCC